MFIARFLPHGEDKERTLDAKTEAELRVELRLVSHAGGAIDRGTVTGPVGETLAIWDPQLAAWHRPGGEPWGVE